MRIASFAASLAALLGCSSDSGVKWPKLYPAKGVVKVGGTPVTTGFLHFRPDDSKYSDFVVTSTVEPDGTFTLRTSHSQDAKLEKQLGAPAGKYTVTYSAQQT